MIVKVKRHNKIEFFNKFSVTLRYDAVASVFSFSLYFDPDNEAHKSLWQPGHYHEVDIEHNGELLIRGQAINNNFASGSKKELTSVAGYSLAGVIEDCNIPTELYPLQHDGKTLLQIAQKITSRFKFDIVVDSAVSSKVNSVFDVSTADEKQTIKDYLSSLASQKDVILSHTPEGDLLFTKAKTKQTPIYHFENGQPNTNISLSFNGQAMHSHITVMKQASTDGGNAGESTIRNPFVPFTYRPIVKIQSSGTDIDTAEAARNALAAELKNIKLTIDTNIWELEDTVIKPNSIITVRDPENYIYEKTRFFVESVTLLNDEEKTTSILNCVLPEVYNGETPEYIFEFDNDK